MFIPTTPKEVQHLGWAGLDVILVTGDSYIDSPAVGVSVIGQVLLADGFRVGIIAQPDVGSAGDISRLGEPELFWGVTGGCIDSLVANYTATGKWRKKDDYTPGGRNEKRPDRAVIAYANLIRRHFKGTAPIVLGGIEASLRRIAHYDFWSNRLRRSILLDTKADYLLYGMAERSVRELAANLRSGKPCSAIRGLCYMDHAAPGGYTELPAWEQVRDSRKAFTEMFLQFYHGNDPVSSKGLCQRYDKRYLVQNPPAMPLESAELDRVYALPYERGLHPFYAREGKVRALDTIRFSVTTHRGCFGECHFCAISMHQGRGVQWRSRKSIVSEVAHLTGLPDFKGIVQDIGGPTANMYGLDCRRRREKGSCRHRKCLVPEICRHLDCDHGEQRRLLREIRRVPGVRHAFIASGIRHDLILQDSKNGRAYLRDVVFHHTSGQMKIAPEHIEHRVLKAMGKPGQASLLEFRHAFQKLSRQAGKKQFLTYYFMAAHPGCTEADMHALREFTRKQLQLSPEQVQVFTPTPSTIAGLMYYTETDPFSGEKLFVEKDRRRREEQKRILVAKGAPAGVRNKDKKAAVGIDRRRPGLKPKRRPKKRRSGKTQR